MIPLRLRREIVAAYTSGRTKTYAATAKMFGVGTATVSRLLRRHREQGDLARGPWARGRKRIVDLEWLENHAKKFPDATLKERADAWEEQGGRRVHLSTMGEAMRAIGWTHKKRLWSPMNATARTSSKRGKHS